MTVFNSLGSNYDIFFVIRSFFKKEKGSKTLLRHYLEKKYNGNVVLTYKGRQALTLSLESLHLPENSEVLITGFTCIAVIDAVKSAGLTPMFVDIEKETLNSSAEKLEKKAKNAKAVIIQNTLGYPCDIEEILKVCKKHKLKLIEDLAHSVGAIYPNGREAGSVGDAVALSFSQDKIVDAVSGGAAILRNSQARSQQPEVRNQTPNFQDKWYPFFTYVIRKTYDIKLGKAIHKILKTLRLLSNPMKTSKLDITDWHAMHALDALRTLEKNLDLRKKISHVYEKNLPVKITSPEIIKQIDKSSNLRFPIFIKNRETLIEKLKESGVYVSDIWYDAPVSPKRFLDSSEYKKGECPNSEEVSESILNLPTHRNVSEKDALLISELIQNFTRSARK